MGIPRIRPVGDSIYSLICYPDAVILSVDFKSDERHIRSPGSGLGLLQLAARHPNDVQYRYNMAVVRPVVFAVDQDIVNIHNSEVVVNVLPQQVNHQSQNLSWCVCYTKQHD